MLATLQEHTPTPPIRITAENDAPITPDGDYTARKYRVRRYVERYSAP